MKRLALIMTVGLLFALLPLTAAAGGGCHSAASPLSADARGRSGDAEVPISKCAFQPTVLWVDPGTTVRWTNNDPVPHTVTGPNFIFGNDADLMDGDSVAYTFDEEGVFPYACIFHPGMNGAIVVGDGLGPDTMSGTAGITQAFDDVPNRPASSTSTVTVEEAGGVSWPAFLASTAVAAVAAFTVGFTFRRRRIELSVRELRTP